MVWKVEIYGVEGMLLKAAYNMHEDAKAAVRVDGTLRECFDLKV